MPNLTDFSATATPVASPPAGISLDAGSGWLTLSRHDMGNRLFPAVCLGSLLMITTAFASPFDDLIQRVAREERIDASLLRAVVAAESAFDANARSPKGAMGLMQLMPGTAQLMGVARPYQPEENLRGGARYLRGLIDRFDRVDYALAGYNAGPENITKYHGIPPFPETEDYLARVEENYGRKLGVGNSRRWRGSAAKKAAVTTPRHPYNIYNPPFPSPFTSPTPTPAKETFILRDARGTLVISNKRPAWQGTPINCTTLGNRVECWKMATSLK